MAKHGLGKGLKVLMADAIEDVAPVGDNVTRIALSEIRANRWQPRQTFDPAALAELIESVRVHGVLQPLIVRQSGEGYELIAGERRMRASLELGLTDVPVRVIDVSDRDALELALIENVQREDLNPVEEADGYQNLADEFGLTQADIATRVGKSRASVANCLRLLSLPEDVRELLSARDISTGHAKVLLSLDSMSEISRLAAVIVKSGMSVRELEALIKRFGGASTKRKPKKKATGSSVPNAHLSDLTNRLTHHFGTGVKLNACKTLANGQTKKGSLEIDFYSDDDLGRIIDVLGLTDY